ncbi:MAG: hypothetical protein ACREL5_12280 [Gemmatimonadales bacterium]
MRAFEMTRHTTKVRESSSPQRELERLIDLASRRPGVAEVLELQERYRAQLAEIELRRGRRTAVIFSTSNSTA